jgi:uncharacterized membrane protein
MKVEPMNTETFVQVSLRFLAKTFVLVLVVALLTVAICFLTDRTTLLQIGAALFWAGAIVIGVGSLTVFGGPGTTQGFSHYYSSSATDSDVDQETRQMLRDKMAGYGLLFLLGTAGVVLLLLGITFQAVAS